MYMGDEASQWHTVTTGLIKKDEQEIQAHTNNMPISRTGAFETAVVLVSFYCHRVSTQLQLTNTCTSITVASYKAQSVSRTRMFSKSRTSKTCESGFPLHVQETPVSGLQ